ncbi:MAG: choline monooxygenase, partial [Planctomycetota bacterium]
PGRCRVRYMRFVSRPELLGQGAGAELDQVELEDQRVVEAVQGRMASRGRVRGRYSLEHEAGVHLFHRLLASSGDHAAARA